MMGINDFIIYIVIFFLIIGAIDKIVGNKLGLGERFTEGFLAMGPLTLAMVGIISLAPVIANILTPIIAPIYQIVGADPATFANTILAIDMGGYALAKEMALTEEAEIFSYVFLGTTMGATIVFTIPVALGMIKKEDQPFFAKGILIGMITVPIGSLVGGLVGGLSISMIVMNLIPTIFFSLLIGFGLWKYPQKMIAGFTWFGKGVETIAIIGLTLAIIETLTDITIIPNMTPLSEGIQIVGQIVIFLAGAFPMVAFIQKVLKKPLAQIGKLLGIDHTATAGLVASLAHSIPMLSILKDMDPKGKVINVAFAVSAAFVLGSHLGFVAGVEKEMVFSMIVGKLVGGIAAIFLAMLTFRTTSTT